MIANIISTKKSGLSKIKLNDSGRTGSTLGPGIVGDVDSFGVGWVVWLGKVGKGESVGFGVIGGSTMIEGIYCLFSFIW